MPMVEDLSVFFNTGEFATVATISGASVTGIKREGVTEVGDVLRPAIEFVCPAADVSGVVDGTAVTVDSVSYTVAGPPSVENDVATLHLLKA